MGNRGGIEEERAERRRIREEASAKHDKNMKAFGRMVQEAKDRKREQVAMRAEDKYSEENDPVESEERRLKRLTDKWKEEHADELKDDAKEHALACLRSEKEGNAQSDVANSAPAPSETCSHPSEPEICGSEDKGKVDNRTLVYEDIWDDP